MDKKKIERIMFNAGNIYFGNIDFEKAALRYVINNPKVTADELSKIYLIPKKNRRHNGLRICSKTVAQKYIDIVKRTK